MSLQANFYAKVVIVDTAAGDAETEIEGAEGLVWEVSQLGEPTQVRFGAPNFDGRYSIGGTHEGLLVASPKTKYVRVELYDLDAADPTVPTIVARGDLQAPQASDSGNPSYQVAAVGPLNRLNVPEVELAALEDPTNHDVIEHLCAYAGLAVDVSGLTLRQYVGTFDFVKINPLEQLKDLVLRDCGGRIKEDPATGGIVVYDPPALGTPAATISRGNGLLLSCTPRRGQQRPITCQVVVGEVPRTGTTTVTVDPPAAYALDEDGKLRLADDTIRIQRFVIGKLESQHDIAQALDGTVRGLASWALQQYAFTAAGFVDSELVTTWSLSGGKFQVTAQVLTEYVHDANNYVTRESVRTWGLSGGKRRVTEHVTRDYDIDVEQLRGHDQIHGKVTVTTRNLQDGKLRVATVHIDDVTSLPDTSSTRLVVDPVEGGWCTTDPAILAAWGVIDGGRIETRWAQDADTCDEIAEREVSRRLYLLDALEVGTYYDPAIALGATVLVQDEAVEVPANDYAVEAIQVALSADRATMQLPLLLPGVA